MLSPDAQARIDQMREECEQRQIERGDTMYSFACVTLEEVVDLAAGIVPLTVQASARMLLDTNDHMRRNAQRPVRAKASTRKQTA